MDFVTEVDNIYSYSAQQYHHLNGKRLKILLLLFDYHQE